MIFVTCTLLLFSPQSDALAQVVRILLDAKADPSLHDAKGRTAGQRTKIEEMQGLLAANESLSSSAPLSAAVLQATLQEMSSKLEVLQSDNSALKDESQQHKTKIIVGGPHGCQHAVSACLVFQGPCSRVCMSQ